MTPPTAGPAGDDLRDEFRESVRAVLKQASASRVPQPVWAAEPTDPFVLDQMASLGWSGLLVEEEYGGAGAGMLEATVVAEELGAHLTPAPFLSSAVLAGTALSAGGSPAQRARWLPALADGRLRGAALLTGPSGRPDAGLLDVTAAADGAGVLLRGVAGLALDAAGADLLVVAARTGELYVVPGATPGVEITELLGVDRTRRLATVVLRDVRMDSSARLERSADALAAVFDRGTVACAADGVGAARRALEMATDYAKQRHQFGRAIGSFQAIKHKLADMYLLVQGASLAVEGAARALDTGVDARRLVAVAGSYARDAATKVTGDAIQVHGGIGYTWEHDCHRLFKRAKFDEMFLGDPSASRDRLARLVLERDGR